MDAFIALFATSQIQWIVTLLGVDIILGIIGSIIKKEFEFGKLGNFMKKMVLGYVFGFAVIEAVGAALPALAFVVPVVFVIVVVALLASIVRNLGEFGVPVPEILRK